MSDAPGLVLLGSAAVAAAAPAAIPAVATAYAANVAIRATFRAFEYKVEKAQLNALQEINDRLAEIRDLLKYNPGPGEASLAYMVYYVGMVTADVSSQLYQMREMLEQAVIDPDSEKGLASMFHQSDSGKSLADLMYVNSVMKSLAELVHEVAIMPQTLHITINNDDRQSTDDRWTNDEE